MVIIIVTFIVIVIFSIIIVVIVPVIVIIIVTVIVMVIVIVSIIIISYIPLFFLALEFRGVFLSLVKNYWSELVFQHGFIRASLAYFLLTKNHYLSDSWEFFMSPLSSAEILGQLSSSRT